MLSCCAAAEEKKDILHPELQIYIHVLYTAMYSIHIHRYTHIYLYMYIYVCAYVTLNSGTACSGCSPIHTKSTPIPKEVKHQHRSD